MVKETEGEAPPMSTSEETVERKVEDGSIKLMENTLWILWPLCYDQGGRFVIEDRLCFECLMPDHGTSGCPARSDACPRCEWSHSIWLSCGPPANAISIRRVQNNHTTECFCWRCLRGIISLPEPY